MMNYTHAAPIAASPRRAEFIPYASVSNYTFKRFFDVTFAVLVICLVLVWLIPLLGLLIRLESPGPIFFRQTRWGKNKRRFQCFKLRSMHYGVSDFRADGRFRQAEKNDERVTRVGAFLRKTNLDALPQFWNVLIGDLSVVGPRPHPEALNYELENVIDYYNLRHTIKPGVTGLAQVTGYRGETQEYVMMEKRLKLDLWYIHNSSLVMDLKIIWWTVTKMFTGDRNAY